MRIAMPIWEDKLSPVLDTALRLLIVDVPPAEERARFEVHLSGKDVLHRTKLVARLKVDVLICGAVSRPFEDMLCAKGVQVVSGLSGRIEDIVDAYFHGRLDQTEFIMPGYEDPTPGLMNRKENPIDARREKWRT